MTFYWPATSGGYGEFKESLQPLIYSFGLADYAAYRNHASGFIA